MERACVLDGVEEDIHPQKESCQLDDHQVVMRSGYLECGAACCLIERGCCVGRMLCSHQNTSAYGGGGGKVVAAPSCTWFLLLMQDKHVEDKHIHLGICMQIDNTF